MSEPLTGFVMVYPCGGSATAGALPMPRIWGVAAGVAACGPDISMPAAQHTPTITAAAMVRFFIDISAFPEATNAPCACSAFRHDSLAARGSEPRAATVLRLPRSVVRPTEPGLERELHAELHLARGCH